MQFRIRAALASDQAFLREMLYQSLYVPEGCDPFERQILDPPDIAKYVEGWGRIGDLGFVAQETQSDAAIAAVWVRLFTSPNPGYGYVDDTIPELGLAVLPHYRGQGIGTDLMCHLFTAAQVQYPGLSLSVSPNNPALRLYQRLGFEIIQ